MLLTLSNRQAFEQMTVPSTKIVTKLLKNFIVMKLYYNIWNVHDKYIQISTNMPSIALIIDKFGVKSCKI